MTLASAAPPFEIRNVGMEEVAVMVDGAPEVIFPGDTLLAVRVKILSGIRIVAREGLRIDLAPAGDESASVEPAGAEDPESTPVDAVQPFARSMRNMVQQGVILIRTLWRVLLTLIVVIAALGLGAQVVNKSEELLTNVADPSAVMWGVQVFAVVALAWGLVVAAVGFERRRDKVPLWLLVVVLVALGVLMATDWSPQRRLSAGRYSVLRMGETYFWRMDTVSGAVDLCGFRLGEGQKGFACRRLDAGAVESRRGALERR